jgi:hypothetical protein
LPVFLGALLVNSVYLAPGGPTLQRPESAVLNRDEGTVLYDSLRISQGQVMYRDFFEFQGPVFYYLNAGVFAVVGPSVTAARAVWVVLAALSSMLIAVLVARFAGRWPGAAAAAIHATSLISMWPHAYPHWYAEAFVLGALVCLTGSNVGRRERIVAGSFFGLAAMTILSLGLPLWIASAVACGVPRMVTRDFKAATQAIGEVLGGGLLVVAVVLAGFAAVGAADDLLYDTLRWPMDNYMIMQVGADGAWASHADEMIAAHGELDAARQGMFVLALWMIVLLPLSAVAALVVAMWRGARDLRRNLEPDGRFFLVAAAGAAAVYPLLVGRVRTDITHVAFVAGVTLPALAAALTRGGIPQRISRWAVAILLVGNGGLALAARADRTVATWSESRELGDWKTATTTEWAPLFDAVGPVDSMFIAGTPGFSYMHHAPARVAFTLIPNEPPGYYTDEQWRRIAREVKDRRPQLLVLTVPLRDFLWALEPELARLYQPTPLSNDAWRIYLAK